VSGATLFNKSTGIFSDNFLFSRFPFSFFPILIFPKNEKVWGVKDENFE
jgi:hypothetical protein